VIFSRSIVGAAIAVASSFSAWADTTADGLVVPVNNQEDNNDFS
jgi:hypothetical protein